ncbi:hypothetical protein FACS189451_08240 [Bacteroidia bacterium]|nr:hypothetical protein FACS189446_5190 [Bacteroidia bacterium]GHT62854.1 hypothetical protein FACS189451_08240 [Bacteroidia bacterium]
MLQNQIQEAEKYLQNAREILSEKAGKQGSYYTDKKYVKMAGNTAWNGVLVALDAALGTRKNLKKSQRLDFIDYQKALVSKAPKMNYILMTAYDMLHKSLGYDGVLSYKTVQDGLKQGKLLIDWAAKQDIVK